MSPTDCQLDLDNQRMRRRACPLPLLRLLPTLSRPNLFGD